MRIVPQGWPIKVRITELVWHDGEFVRDKSRSGVIVAWRIDGNDEDQDDVTLRPMVLFEDEEFAGGQLSEVQWDMKIIR